MTLMLGTGKKTHQYLLHLSHLSSIHCDHSLFCCTLAQVTYLQNLNPFAAWYGTLPWIALHPGVSRFVPRYNECWPWCSLPGQWRILCFTLAAAYLANGEVRHLMVSCFNKGCQQDVSSKVVHKSLFPSYYFEAIREDGRNGLAQRLIPIILRFRIIVMYMFYIVLLWNTWYLFVRNTYCIFS